MNIVLLHDRPEAAHPSAQGAARVDGVVSYLIDIAEALRDAGHTVIQLAVGKDLPPEGSADEGWITRPASGVRRNHAEETEITDLLRGVSPDVVHFHGIDYVMHPALRHHLSQSWPTVLTLHDVGLFCPKGTRLRRDQTECTLRRGAICLASGCHRPWQTDDMKGSLLNLALATRRLAACGAPARIVCPSRYIADLGAQHGLPQDRLRVVHNFSRFAPQRPPRPNTGQLLFVGRMERTKGFDILIDALQRLPDVPWHLHAIGFGSLRDSATSQLGSDRVTITDPLPLQDLPQQFQNADMIVLPYKQPESFGMVGVEALSQGCPVLGFPAGGAAEWMRPEFGATPVRSPSAAALAQAIRDALETPPVLPDAPWPFTLQAHVAQLEAVYNEARAHHG